MRWLSLLIGISLFSSPLWAPISQRLSVTEEDTSPDTYPWRIKFANGTVTDNGDGTTSITSSGGGGGIVSPGTFTWTNSFGISLSTLTVSSTATFNGGVAISSTLALSGSYGVSGQVLQSNGPSTVPTWATPASGGGGGYALEPATVTIRAEQGLEASTMTVSSNTILGQTTFYADGTGEMSGDLTVNFYDGVTNSNLNFGQWTFRQLVGDGNMYIGRFFYGESPAITILPNSGSGGELDVATLGISNLVLPITAPGTYPLTIGQQAFQSQNTDGHFIIRDLINNRNYMEIERDEGNMLWKAGNIVGTYGVVATTVTVTGLADGQCVQTGTGGELTVTGSACGSGGGGGGYSLQPATVTVRLDQGMTATVGTFTSSIAVQGAGGIGSTYGISGGSLTANDLTASLPVQTNSNKKLISGPISLSTAVVGTLQAAQEPAHTGDVTNTAGSLAMTAAESQANILTVAGSSFTVSGASGLKVSNYVVVGGSLNVTGAGGFRATYGAIVGSMTVSNLASGQCVQTDTGGLLTVTGSACGAGGGGGGYSLEPSTKTLRLDLGFTASSGTFTSSVTVLGAGGILNSYNLKTSSATFPSIATPVAPVNGTVWNDTTYNSFVSSIGAILQNIPTTLFTIKASSNSNNVSTRADWFGSGNITGAAVTSSGITLPPNFWTVGKTIYIVLVGTQSRTGTPTLLPSVSLNGTVMLSTGAIALGSFTAETPGRGWQLIAELTCYRTGASGLITGTGVLDFYGSISVDSVYTLKPTGNTIDTTAATSLQFSTTFGTANALNSITLMGGHGTVLY